MSKSKEKKMMFIKEYREYYGKSPSAKELQYFDSNGSPNMSTNEIKDIKKMNKRFNKNNKIAEIHSESKKRKVIDTIKKDGVYVPLKYPPVSVEPRPLVVHEKPMPQKRKASWWNKQKTKSNSWWDRRKESKRYKSNREPSHIAWRSNKGQAINTGIAATQKAGRTAARFGYALPGPFQVFTLAFSKMTKTLKLLIVLVFALAILFVPYGVLYFTGWAVGAAFMFLVSLIFWVFISMFNGIAFVLVSFINMVTSAIMGSIIFIAEFILTPLMGVTAINQNGDGYYKWVAGRELFANSLIKYGDIAAVPSLMHIVEPSWQPWMNDTLLGHVLGLLGVSLNFSWLTKPFSDFYSGLDATQAVVIGCIIIAIPIIFLVVVYYKNRHHMYG